MTFFRITKSRHIHAYIDLCVNIRDTGTSEDITVPFTLITQENAENYLNY